MNRFEQTQQWMSGKAVADFLDTYFGARGWNITPTTPHEERRLQLGDRHFRKGGLHYLVEYKSGIQTAATGNVFLETISVDSAGKPGWVFTCQADYIFYAALLNKKVLVFIPDKLRLVIRDLQRQFPTVKTGKRQNEGYDTHGVIVPLAYVEKHLSARTYALLEE